MNKISQSSNLTRRVATEQDRQLDNVIRDTEKLISNVNELVVINTSNSSLTQVMTAINSGSVNVAFIGTSITEGYNAQMEGYNIYAYEAVRRLQSKYPNVTFNWNNFGLASRDISNFIDKNFKGVESPDPNNGTGYYRAGNEYSWQTPSVIGQTWEDAVKLSSPDILFCEFGMNSSYSHNTFRSNYEQLISNINSWDKVPTIVLITEMLPTLNSDPYLDKNGLIKLYNEHVREVASANNLNVIDVERNWQLLRDGKNPLIVQKVGITLNSLTQITGGSPADVLTFNSMEETTNVLNYAIQQDIARVVTMTCTYTPKSAASTLQMGVRFSKAKSEAWNGGVVIQLRNADITFYENAASVQVTPHTAIVATNPHTVEFSFALDTLTVTVDSVVIGSYTVASKFDFGNMSFGGTDFLAEDVEIVLEDSNPIVQTAKYTGNELVGNKTATDWNNGDVRDGGNSINHPSRVGLREAYYPAIHDFVYGVML